HLYLLDDTHRHPPSSPNKSTRTSGQQAGYLHNPTNLKDVPLVAAYTGWLAPDGLEQPPTGFNVAAGWIWYPALSGENKPKPSESQSVSA
ncbi:MAG: hypothetical protein ACYC91_19170, partial [Solirubrobacteraceae bacterium]